MQIIDWLQFLTNGLPLNKKKSAITVGVFDGVHLGHQALIERIVSRNADCVPVVVTFRDNHKTRNAEILTFYERTALLEKLGVEILLVVNFTDDFKNMPGLEFLDILYKHASIGFFAVGCGFRCGCGLDTDATAIQDYFSSRNVQAEIVPEVLENGQPVSSSRIRACLASGEVELAERMLGRKHISSIKNNWNI